MSHDEITCRKLILEYLVDYEDGSMPEAERQDLEKHLSHCPPCVVFLRTIERRAGLSRCSSRAKFRRTSPRRSWSFVRARCRDKE